MSALTGASYGAHATLLPRGMQKSEDPVQTLATYLKALASDSRLELLAALRSPKTLEEIVLAPSESRADPRPDRAVSRQAVQRHLDVLLEIGLVRRRLTRRGVSRSGYEYLLDHTRVFAVLEEMRQLTAYRSELTADLVETQSGEPGGAARWAPGPKLVVVHGVREGHAFDLRAHEGGKQAWTIGRSEEAHASLPHDPFVSFENAGIERTPAGYVLRDHAGSRNGTTLNWQPLPRGGERPLRSGDVIGVGRTLLLFRDS